jgi:NAD(P)-dependent dehydrogenase (short-subunit alcohol dehydrogenase family)
MAYPAHYGVNFTPTTHTKPSPQTDPTTISLPKPFVVLIAGSGKGIGEQIALSYAKAGASGIILSARSPHDLEIVSQKIKYINPSIKTLCAPSDVTVESSVSNLAKQTEAAFGRLDVLINNAGTTNQVFTSPDGTKRYPRGLLEGSTADFQRAFNLNFYGPYFLSRYLLPLLIKTKDGPQALINVVSAALQMNFSEMAPMAYSLSKSAVARLTEHIDSAHAREGICAFAVHPGSVVTPMTSTAPPGWENSK